MSTGNLFVITGPSGVGKGTLLAEAVKLLPDPWFSISATTRKPRPHEVDGVDYYFVTDEEFDKLIAEDDLLEWAQYTNNRYGTPRVKVQEAINQGKQVLLDIEIQGAMNVKRLMPEARLIFIAPPSVEELEKRLIGRGTETLEQIQARLAEDKDILQRQNEFDYVIVNDTVERASQEMMSYMTAVQGE